MKIQRAIFARPEKELTRQEYDRLVRAAQEQHNERLSLLLQAICSTGIRVSELRYITVIPFRDSTMAVQYMHNHPKMVDCLFSSLLMRRVDGLQLMVHLHQTSPGAAAYIIAETDTWELRSLA